MKASGFEEMARTRMLSLVVVAVLAISMLTVAVRADDAAPTTDAAPNAAGTSHDEFTLSLPPPYEPKAPGGLNILCARADGDAEPTRSYLLSFSEVSIVDDYDLTASTPTLTEMSDYDLIFTWTNSDCDDSNLWGDRLADYIDDGGKVVLLDFAWYSDDGLYSIAGRIMSEGYSPLTSLDGHNHYSWANLGTYDAGHPLMYGVTAVSAYYRDWVSLTPGATLIASWDDGEEFIAEKGNVLAVNLFQGFSWGGEYPIILQNIIRYQIPSVENWIDSDWTQALPVSVQNPNAEDLTDYQVKIIVPYHNGMRLDYGDLRFAESAGEAFLPHWMEKSSRVSATFWVRVPSILAASDIVSLVAYFDNPNAQSASDGTATFQFFDDFPGTAVDTTKWGGDTGGFTVSNGYLRGSSTTFSLRSLSGLTDPVALETRTKANVLAANGQITLGFWESTVNSIGILEHAPLPGQYWYHNSGGGAWTGPWQFNFEAWHNARIGITSANTGSLYVINDLGDTTQQSFNVDVSNERITIGQRYDSIIPGQAYDQLWDWIFARNYAAAEPTTSAWNRPVLNSGGQAQHWADWSWVQAVDIIVTNPNPVTLMNHQVKVVVPLLFGMQADFDDLRFTEGFGDGFLPYWMQSSTPTTATYWVKVTQLPASGGLRLRAYFDNPIAHSASDGNEVFTFFDSFDNTALDTTKWDEVNTGSGTTTVGTSQVTIASGGDWWLNSDDARYLVTKRGSSFPTNYVTECNVIQVGADAYNRFFGLRSGSAANAMQFVLLRDADGSHITNVFRDTVGGAANWYGENTGVVNPGNNQIAKFVRVGNQVTSSYGGTNANTRTIGNWGLSYVALTDTHTTGNPSIFDWVFVRQYAATDPTHVVSAAPIFRPAPGTDTGDDIVEVLTVELPGSSDHLREPPMESSDLFNNMAWMTVLVTVGGVTVLLIGGRMRRRD